MQLEKSVSSFNLSQELKALGVVQQSLWYYLCIADGEDWKLNLTRGDGFPDEHVVSAFTVAELGEMLKDKQGHKFFLCGYYLPKRDCFDLNLETSDRAEIIWEVRAKTEANARAKMLIHLLKNNSGKIT